MAEIIKAGDGWFAVTRTPDGRFIDYPIIAWQLTLMGSGTEVKPIFFNGVDLSGVPHFIKRPDGAYSVKEQACLTLAEALNLCGLGRAGVG
jgi:hypothetical protein